MFEPCPAFWLSCLRAWLSEDREVQEEHGGANRTSPCGFTFKTRRMAADKPFECRGHSAVSLTCSKPTASKPAVGQAR